MNKKVILVEDDDLIRELYAKELTQAGFEVSSFPTGNAALASIGTTHYNLMLLDIMLPDTNGLEVLKTIKANPQSNYLPVLLLTNLGQDSVVKQGFSLGAEGYLMKVSYTPDQIIEEVNRVLAKFAHTNTVQS